jgi:hypothetical protein
VKLPGRLPFRAEPNRGKCTTIDNFNTADTPPALPGRGQFWPERYRPMIIRWTWLVPSTIWRALASRM